MIRPQATTSSMITTPRSTIMKTTAIAFVTTGLALLLTGCGLGVSPVATPVQVTAAAGAQGTFMGGQQPVGNILIQVYQTGTAGYGSAATGLLASGSTRTTAAGNFNLPAFSCTSGTQLYIVGTGGQPIPGTTNANLALMSLLGPCSSYNPSTFINVNEITSVAAVYSISPFMTGIANVGTSATNASGLANAFQSFNKIANSSNGTLATPGGAAPTTLPANATLPSTLINTLADVMEQCVNSAGGAATDTSTGCGKLFSYTPNSAGTPPTDTINAMLNIAQHPTVNTAQLNSLRSASPVFTPVLSVNAPPAAWNIGITYTGGGLGAPSAVAVDTSGNVWVTNKSNSTVSKFSNVGVALSPAAGFTAGGISVPAGIAIDLTGTPWITNSASNSVTKLATSGTSGTNYSGNGLASPKGIAIDSNNQVWVTNTTAGAGVSVFTNSGTATSFSPITPAGGLTTPGSIAVSPR